MVGCFCQLVLLCSFWTPSRFDGAVSGHHFGMTIGQKGHVLHMTKLAVPFGRSRMNILSSIWRNMALRNTKAPDHQGKKRKKTTVLQPMKRYSMWHLGESRDLHLWIIPCSMDSAHLEKCLMISPFLHEFYPWMIIKVILCG